MVECPLHRCSGKCRAICGCNSVLTYETAYKGSMPVKLWARIHILDVFCDVSHKIASGILKRVPFRTAQSAIVKIVVEVKPGKATKLKFRRHNSLNINTQAHRLSSNRHSLLSIVSCDFSLSVFSSWTVHYHNARKCDRNIRCRRAILKWIILQL